MIPRVLLIVLLTCAYAPATVSYSRFLQTGSTGDSSIQAVTSDAAGNVYLTGTTTYGDLPTTPGVVQPKLTASTCSFIFDPHSPPYTGPCSDAFVVKLDTAGNIVFATYLGGSGIDAGLAIAVDAAGAVYVAGRTSHQAGGGNDFPVTAGAAYRAQSTLVADGFVAKLNFSGTLLQYSTLIPGAGHGSVGLAVDASGNAYFGGNSLPSEGAFPVTAGAFQSTASMGSAHSVVAKVNPTGSALVYSTYVTGSFDYLADLGVDAAGAVYLTGTIYGKDFPVTAGSFASATPKGFYTAYVAKLNPEGSALEYATFLGGSNGESATRIRVDAQGEAVVRGLSDSKDFPTTSGAFETSNPWPAMSGVPAIRPFLTKLNAAGSALVYSTFLDGAATLALDTNGNAYVAGQASYGFPVTPGASQRCAASSADALAVELDRTGGLVAASYLGGLGNDAATGVAIGTDGFVYVVGTTSSVDLPGAAQPITAMTQTFLSRLKIADAGQPDRPCMARVLQNSASFAEGPVAAGELVTLRGLDFGPDAGVTAGENPFPDRLAGVQVFFDGVAAPLLYVQSQQINVQAPWELAGRPATQVHVEYNGVPAGSAVMQVAPSALGLFSRLNGTQQGAIVNEDGSANSAQNPARRGSVVELYGTGAQLSSPGVTGGLWPLTPLSVFTQPVKVTIGGTVAEVTYAGSAPLESSGLVQVNVRVPQNLEANAAYAILMILGNGSNGSLCCMTIAVQ